MVGREHNPSPWNLSKPTKNSDIKILTFNILDLHFPGNTLSLEIIEVSLKLDPFLK